MIYLKLFRESILFAFDALRQNKLRTILSLLGVTIGIFVIITVFAAVDTLRNKLHESVDKLGNNSIYIGKWPWAVNDPNYPWWKYMQRPDPSLRDYEALKQRSETAMAVSYEIQLNNRTVKYGSNTVSNVGVGAVSHDHDKVWNFDLSQGRYFTDIESNTGAPVTILGFDVAADLFPNGTAIGKQVKVMGRYVSVIGVFSKEGDDILGNSDDKTLLLPINYVRDLVDVQNDQYQPTIVVRGKSGISGDAVQSEMEQLMRSIRRIKPGGDDSFALNESTILSNGLDQMFSIIDIAGAIIGGFSVLIGGFGIANIMFVSVRERTNIIGIQKSLGAKNYFILLQFLIESVILCVMGGLIGLAFVYLAIFGIKGIFDVNVVMDTSNIIMGMFISITIGIISGFIPAYSASRMNPVEAIRSN
jgi:putative ABC transport system permease protein